MGPCRQLALQSAVFFWEPNEVRKGLVRARREWIPTLTRCARSCGMTWCVGLSFVRSRLGSHVGPRATAVPHERSHRHRKKPTPRTSAASVGSAPAGARCPVLCGAGSAQPIHPSWTAGVDVCLIRLISKIRLIVLSKKHRLPRARSQNCRKTPPKITLRGRCPSSWRTVSRG